MSKHKLIYRITMNNAEISPINKKLDALIAIMLNQTKIEGETSREKITLLIRLDFENQEIANILNSTVGLIAKERSLLKKRKKK